MCRTMAVLAMLSTTMLAVPAMAQDAADRADGEAGTERRTRVALGPALAPAFPGSDRLTLRPFFDFSRADGDEVHRFSAADESFSIALFDRGGFAAGGVLGFEGARQTRDARGLPFTGFTVEPGGFAQYTFAAPVRVRLELRHGIGGHEGLIGNASADFVVRDRDDWLFAVGPRVSFSNGRYQRAYFGVPAASVAATGLPAFRPDGGVHAVGVGAQYIKQLTDRWDLYAFARYDRLIDDAARSPYVRRDGSRSQPSFGVAATYTFRSRRD